MTPVGSQGTLCLAGSHIGRFLPPFYSGDQGTYLMSADLTRLPAGLPVAVQAGETWNFQAWFRDMNPGPTSNFTDGISLTFQ